jgi:hypothetical protein
MSRIMLLLLMQVGEGMAMDAVRQLLQGCEVSHRLCWLLNDLPQHCCSHRTLLCSGSVG